MSEAIVSRVDVLSLLKSELRSDGTLSTRGVARLAGVDESAIRKGADFSSTRLSEMLVSRGVKGADFSSTKLTEPLADSGIEGAALKGADFSSTRLSEMPTSKGIEGAAFFEGGWPVEAVVVVLEYYAFHANRKTDQARNLLLAFGTLGLTMLFEEVLSTKQKTTSLSRCTAEDAKRLQRGLDLTLAQKLEEVRYLDEEGQEFWYARDLAEILKYKNGYTGFFLQIDGGLKGLDLFGQDPFSHARSLKRRNVYQKGSHMKDDYQLSPLACMHILHHLFAGTNGLVPEAKDFFTLKVFEAELQRPKLKLLSGYRLNPKPNFVFKASDCEEGSQVPHLVQFLQFMEWRYIPKELVKDPQPMKPLFDFLQKWYVATGRAYIDKDTEYVLPSCERSVDPLTATRNCLRIRSSWVCPDVEWKRKGGDWVCLNYAWKKRVNMKKAIKA